MESKVVIDGIFKNLYLVGSDFKARRFTLFYQVVEEKVLRSTKLHLGPKLKLLLSLIHENKMSIEPSRGTSPDASPKRTQTKLNMS